MRYCARNNAVRYMRYLQSKFVSEMKPIDKQELEDVMKALTQRESGAGQTVQIDK